MAGDLGDSSDLGFKKPEEIANGSVMVGNKAFERSTVKYWHEIGIKGGICLDSYIGDENGSFQHILDENILENVYLGSDV